MRRALPTLLVGALVVGGGCPGEEPFELPTSVESSLCGRVLYAEGAEIDTEMEIDCTGMNSVRQLGTTQAESLLRVFDPAVPPAVVSVARCALYMQEPLVTPQQDLLLTGANAGPGKTGVAAITIAHRGSNWRSWDGCMRLDSYDATSDAQPGKGRGRYEVVLVETAYDDIMEVGRVGIARGEVSWCEYSNRDDCEGAVDATGLTQAVAIDAPGGYVDYRETAAFEGATGLATECRVLLGANGGVRVDLQLGVFNNVPILVIGNACFGNGLQREPSPNRFVFEAGGVDGPGTYGPFERCGGGEHSKPWFEWTIPRAWEGRMETAECLGGYLSHHSYVRPLEESLCTYTIEAEPGRFELDCDTAWWAPDPGLPGSPQIGPFHLEADCDVVVQ